MWEGCGVIVFTTVCIYVGICIDAFQQNEAGVENGRFALHALAHACGVQAKFDGSHDDESRKNGDNSTTHDTKARI
jgi:hypothetical protein